MISKEQANAISDQLLNDANTPKEPIKKLTSKKGLIPLLALIPFYVIFISGTHASKSEGFIVSMAVISILAVVIAYKRFHTPYMEIDDTDFIYYGLWPMRKQIAPIDEITKVTFYSKLRFWRSSRTISFQLKTGDIQITLPYDQLYSAAQISRFLKSNFGEKFVEITL